MKSNIKVDFMQFLKEGIPLTNIYFFKILITFKKFVFHDCIKYFFRVQKSIFVEPIVEKISSTLGLIEIFILHFDVICFVTRKI